MGASARTGGRRADRRQAAQQRAKRRRVQRIALTVGIVAIAALVVGGVIWRMSGDDGENIGQAVYAFDTADYHSLAFDPDDLDTLYFGHHGGQKVSHDGGESWNDARLRGVDVMQQSIPTDGSGLRYAAGHNVFSVSTDGGESWASPQTNLPGLDIHGFAAAPSDGMRLYAFEVSSAGFYTSADGGTSWDSLPLPPGMQTGMLPLAVGHDDPLHVFAGVGNQVLESRDGGASWTPIPGPGRTVVAVATSPDDPQVLYAGTLEGLFKRTSGDTWTKMPVSADGSVLAIAIHPDDANRIAMLDQQGKLYRSYDGGVTWN